MSTSWVKPGEGASLGRLLEVAKEGGRSHAELRIYRMIDRHGKNKRTNLFVTANLNDIQDYDLDRIEDGVLEGRGGVAL